MGSDYTKGIILVTGNPVVSLFIGLLAPVLIQSSSTLTSSLVALVASNVITLEAAAP
jgi:sodium-dependent phosphate cotransporter